MSSRLPRRDLETYVTSPSRLYPSSPAKQHGTDMFTAARTTGNAGIMEIHTGAGMFSPRSVQKELYNEMNIVVDPPDLSPLQQMMEEMKAEIRGAMATIRSDLQSDMSILQQEVVRNREDARSQGESVLLELQTFGGKVEDAMEERLHRSRSTSETRQQQILDAIGRIRIDHNPVLEALRKIQSSDSETIGRAITDRLRKHNVATREDLKKIESLDVETIGRAITDRLRKHNVASREECVEILGAVRRISDDSEILEITRGLGRALEDMQSMFYTLQRNLPDRTSLAGAVIDRLDLNPIMHEISKMSSVSDTRLASLQREIGQLRDGLSERKVVVPQTQAMVNQMVQPPVAMQRIVSVPTVLSPRGSSPPQAIGTQVISGIATPVTSTPLMGGIQPQMLRTGTQELVNLSPRLVGTQELVNLSPRVIAELHGPRVSLPAIPISETVQMKVLPAGYPQETTLSSAAEVLSAVADGYTSSSRQDSPRTPAQSFSPVTHAQDVNLKEELSSPILGPPRGYHVKSVQFRGNANV